MWPIDASQIALYSISLCGIAIVLFLAFRPMRDIRIKGLIIIIAYLVVALVAALVSFAMKSSNDVSVLITRAIVFEGFPSLIALLTSLLTFINAKLDVQKEAP